MNGTSPSPCVEYRQRQVVCAVKLHLDTVRFLRSAGNGNTNSLYEVEGKMRPAIVLGTARSRYRILYCTSKEKKGYFPLGNSLSCDAATWVDVSQVHHIPENMLKVWEWRPGTLLKPGGMLEEPLYRQVLQCLPQSLEKQAAIGDAFGRVLRAPDRTGTDKATS